MSTVPMSSIRPAVSRATAAAASVTTRSFASSSTVRLPEAPSAGDTPASNRKPQLRKTPLGRFNISYLEEFQFDDNTSLGFMRLERMRERVELIKKIEADRAVLQSQRKAFTPPTSPIRIRSTIDLANPTSSTQQKQVLLVPLAALPLETPEAVQRAKHIAGPRWSVGRPGANELEQESEQGLKEAGVFGVVVKGTTSTDGTDAIGRHGWIKMSEERFPDARMNRRSLGDTLERLVAAANDPKSPIPADLPVDERHLLDRLRKKKSRSAGHDWRRAEALKARPEAVGGVQGFPKEWLAPRQA